ncbi:MAG: hypothetical protein RLZZ63_122 [Gemmatimonadota bacterium]|jgi:outer membrane protein OmpA-like peptidoglycan-associated protein
MTISLSNPVAPMRLFRARFSLLAAVVCGLPVSAAAQACLGLHAARDVVTAEAVSNFHRDGVTGPSTFGISVNTERFFAAVETGADLVERQAAPLANNGIAGTLGVAGQVGRVSGCVGGTVARQEVVQFTPTTAESVFGALAVQLPAPFGMSLSAFGSMAYDIRTELPEGVSPFTRKAAVYRAGVSSYPRPWLGVRLYQDITGDDRRLGFSVGFVAPISKARPAPVPVVEDTVRWCPATPSGQRVAVADGCPTDSDGDGVLDAKDRCPDTPAGATVNASGCPIDTDGDGVFDLVDACPNSPPGVPVDAKGCPLDTDGDGVIDARDACPATPAGAVVDATGCVPDADADGVGDAADRCPNTRAGTKVDARGCPELFATSDRFTLTGVTFEQSKSFIRASSFAQLDEVAQALVANPEVRVEIAGHTDAMGSPAFNRTLSHARATVVRDYLVTKGVAADRMEIRGYGPSKPVASNATPVGREQNRRVEMSRLK